MQRKNIWKKNFQKTMKHYQMMTRHGTSFLMRHTLSFRLSLKGLTFFLGFKKNTFTFSSNFKKPFNGKTKNEKVSEVLNIPPMHTKILELFTCNIEDDDEVEIIKFTIYKFASEKLSSVPI